MRVDFFHGFQHTFWLAKNLQAVYSIQLKLILQSVQAACAVVFNQQRVLFVCVLCCAHDWSSSGVALQGCMYSPKVRPRTKFHSTGPKQSTSEARTAHFDAYAWTENLDGGA